MMTSQPCSVAGRRLAISRCAMHVCLCMYLPQLMHVCLCLCVPQLIKSFDFSFGFCIPGSTNTWTAVYSLPPLSDELGACMQGFSHS